MNGIITHEFENIDQETKNKHLEEITVLGICKGHDLPFTSFCKKHGYLCCCECESKCHHACKDVKKLVEVAEHAEDRSMDIKEGLERLHARANRIITHIQKSSPFTGSTESKIDTVLEEIEKAKETMMKTFDDLKRKVYEKATWRMEKSQKELEGMRILIQGTMADVKKNSDILNSVIADRTPVQKFVVSHVIESRLISHETTVQEQQEKAYMHIKFELNPKLMKLLQPDTETIHPLVVSKIPLRTEDADEMTFYDDMIAIFDAKLNSSEK